MHPEWLLAVPIFGLGFVAGYFMRAMISRRRRRQSRWSEWERRRDARGGVGEAPQFGPGLQHRLRRDAAAQPDNDLVREVADGPDLAKVDPDPPIARLGRL